VDAKLTVLNCGVSAEEDAKFEAVKSVLSSDTRELLRIQGRLLIVAEPAASVTTAQKAK
jgi:hypothetical protein